MEWVLFITALVVAITGYWKQESLKRLAIVAGGIVVAAIILAAIIRVFVARVDWIQAPSVGRVGLLAVAVIVAIGLACGMVWLVRRADMQRVKKDDVPAETPDETQPYPEPIQKIESFWRRHFRKGE